MANVKTDHDRFDEAVEIAVTRSMKASIEIAAREMGLSASAFCRLLIKERIEQRTDSQALPIAPLVQPASPVAQ